MHAGECEFAERTSEEEAKVIVKEKSKAFNRDNKK